MKLPDGVLRVLERAAKKHPTDIEAALTQAMRELPKLSEYPAFVDTR